MIRVTKAQISNGETTFNLYKSRMTTHYENALFYLLKQCNPFELKTLAKAYPGEVYAYMKNVGISTDFDFYIVEQ